MGSLQALDVQCLEALGEKRDRRCSSQGALPGGIDPITKLRRRLEERARPKSKRWWEGYLKGAISFRGVKMADIRTALHAWVADEGIYARLSLAEQRDLALSLLCEQYAEDKLAGILFLQEVLLPVRAINWRSDLIRFAHLFEEGYISDWNTCDWFCVKVLGPLVKQDGEGCARAIARWRDASNLWQRRASGVAFVNLAPYGDANFKGFTDMLLEVCAATIQHKERFAQTGTAWVLRELTLAEPERVATFIEAYGNCFSNEALTSATRKMPAPIRESLTAKLRKRS